MYKIPFISNSFPGKQSPRQPAPRHHSYPRAGHSAFTFCTPALLCDRRNFTLIAKTNGLFPVSGFYTRVKMSVLFDFYGATGMAHQHHMPAEQMFLVSVKVGGYSLFYVLLGFYDWVLGREKGASLSCFLWFPG